MMETASKAPVKKPKDTVLVVAPTPSMKIISDEITIQNSNLKYDDQSVPKAPAGMDFSHLDIQQLIIKRC